ncbi:hypothetical protein [Streptomyces sp. ICC1]|nr:hypothetical protein [Streptomyces sp. ICC1]
MAQPVRVRGLTEQEGKPPAYARPPLASELLLTRPVLPGPQQQLRLL